MLLLWVTSQIRDLLWVRCFNKLPATAMVIRIELYVNGPISAFCGLQGKSSWLQIQRSGCDSHRYHIFPKSTGSWLQLRSNLNEKVAASAWKTEITAIGDPPRWPRDISLSAKVSTNFAEKWRSLGWYSSLVDKGHGISYDSLAQNWYLIEGKSRVFHAKHCETISFKINVIY
jgi:hypothetical protein